MTMSHEDAVQLPTLTEQEAFRQRSMYEQVLIAQAYGAMIALYAPPLRDNTLAQEIDRQTGLGMDIARVALS